MLPNTICCDYLKNHHYILISEEVCVMLKLLETEEDPLGVKGIKEMGIWQWRLKKSGPEYSKIE
jgi:hypothetical protein